MDNSKFRVVKTTIRTGCDLAREVVKSNLPQAKAKGLRDSLNSKVEAETFDPGCMVTYLCEPA